MVPNYGYNNSAQFSLLQTYNSEKNPDITSRIKGAIGEITPAPLLLKSPETAACDTPTTVLFKVAGPPEIRAGTSVQGAPLTSEIRPTSLGETCEIGGPELHPSLVLRLCTFVTGRSSVRRGQQDGDQCPSGTSSGVARVRYGRILREALACTECVCSGAANALKSPR